MTVKDIVMDYLELYGYTGLFHEKAGCACNLDDLFYSCATGNEDCQPGYQVPCDCGGEHVYDVVPNRK